MGEHKEALKLFLECDNYFKGKDIRSVKYLDNYQRNLFALADSYKSLGKIDSASYYNKLGYIESKKTNNDKLHYLFILNEGANQTLKKNYKAAIDSVDIALPKIKKMTGIGNNILASYYYYGKAYAGLKNNNKAIDNFNKVDSIYQKTKVITPEFTDGYHYLIDYYKSIDNKEKQLYYINSLMTIDSAFQVNYKDLSKKLHNEYDVPHLMQEKELLIKTLKKDKKANYGIIILLGFVGLAAVFFGIKQVQQKKLYQARFNALVNEPTETQPLEPAADHIKGKSNALGISTEIVETVLVKLAVFEKEKRYLNPTINSTSLAEEFSTNTKYLSSIINTIKEKSFTNYINDLRIDYIIEELKKNKKLRSYTISSIAEEAGFKTGESFSKAFVKSKELKPSYFIRKWEEL